MSVHQQVKEIVEQWTGTKISDDTVNLFDASLQISIPDFLYVFNELERQLNINAFEFLEKKPYTDFTIKGISEFIESQCLAERISY